MAQRLYEAGLITYMRTDSVNLSDEAKNGAKAESESAYGLKYSKTRNYKGLLEFYEYKILFLIHNCDT